METAGTLFFPRNNNAGPAHGWLRETGIADETKN
jgi:hypothetical protein